VTRFLEPLQTLHQFFKYYAFPNRIVNPDCQQICLLEEKECLNNRVDLGFSRGPEASDRWYFRYSFQTPQTIKTYAQKVSQRNAGSAVGDLGTHKPRG